MGGLLNQGLYLLEQAAAKQDRIWYHGVGSFGNAWFGGTYQFTKEPTFFLCDTIEACLALHLASLYPYSERLPAEQTVLPQN
jgi:hypothetical protein